MEPRQLRDKANEALTKGRFSQAADLFEKYCQLDPKDFQARVRLGDVWVKAGNNARAIVAYQAAAEGFAREGFLPRAIAASKLILELDPSHHGVQEMLASLYARRSGPPKPGLLSRAPTPLPIPTPASVKQAVAPEAPAPTPAPPVRMELKPGAAIELEEEVASDSDASPGIEVELDLEDGSAASSSDIEVELDLGDAEQGSAQAAPSQPTATQAAPPGLRPRRSSDIRPIIEPEKAPVPAPPVTPAPPARPAAPVAAAPTTPRIERFTPQADVSFESPMPDSTPFTELEIQADSLLHAVELAARAGAVRSTEPAPAGQVADEPGQDGGEDQVSETPTADGGLPKIPLFSDLPSDAFIALFERCPLRRFPEGARIIEQGSKGNAFYVICAGRVRIVRQRGDEQQELAVLSEGAFFGEMALLSGAPRSASVVGAAEETQVLEISAPVLAELSRSYPQVAKALRRFCRQRLLSDVVNTSALFQPFGRKDRRQLVERFLAREVRRGDVIIHEGNQVDGLYVVLSGEVAVSKGGQSLASLREGELFGEMSLLQKTPATATVTAARNTSLLRLPREAFDTLILTHPQILELISGLSETRQRQTRALMGGDPETSESGGERFDDLMLF